MTLSQRIHLARRHAGFSQRALADEVGVQRSAVSHWESGKQPTTANLGRVALITEVNFEWLATGRGVMTLSEQVRMDSIPAAHGLLVEDPQEVRLLESIRAMSTTARIALTEIAEQLAARRGRRAGSAD